MRTGIPRPRLDRSTLFFPVETKLDGTLRRVQLYRGPGALRRLFRRSLEANTGEIQGRWRHSRSASSIAAKIDGRSPRAALPSLAGALACTFHFQSHTNEFTVAFENAPAFSNAPRMAMRFSGVVLRRECSKCFNVDRPMAELPPNRTASSLTSRERHAIAETKCTSHVCSVRLNKEPRPEGAHPGAGPKSVEDTHPKRVVSQHYRKNAASAIRL